MTRFEAWFMHAGTLLVGGTGLVYAAMRYFMHPDDPYAMVNHPWQPTAQHLHVLVAPLLVFAAGLIWRPHVWDGIRSRHRARRASGLVVASSFVPMAVSGTLIQVATEETWRQIWVGVHLATAAIWIAGYLAHQLRQRRAERAAGGPPSTMIELRPRSMLLTRDLDDQEDLSREMRGRRARARRRRRLPRGPLMLALGLGAGVVSMPVPAPGVVVERELGLMGTILRISVSAPSRDVAMNASERAVAVLEAAEVRLSTWRDDTELARLNRSPVGEPFALSPALERDLTSARRFWSLTGGAFDPGIGALVSVWGLRSVGRMPGIGERQAAREASGLDHLALIPGAAIRMHPGFGIEEGGFGKGAALDDAARALEGLGIDRAILDLGGQVMVVGDGGPLVFAVADPRDRRRPVLELPLVRGSAATSGNSERGLSIAGERMSHILDARTGWPCRDFGSVTVLAPDALTADCLSTGLFVCGPDSALAWARSRPVIEVVVVETTHGGLRVRATPGIAPHLSPMVSDLTLAPTGD